MREVTTPLAGPLLQHDVLRGTSASRWFVSTAIGSTEAEGKSRTGGSGRGGDEISESKGDIKSSHSAMDARAREKPC